MSKNADSIKMEIKRIEEDIRLRDEYNAQRREQIKALEAELAALPAPPVELVAEEWTSDRNKLIVTAKDSVFGVCIIPKDSCTHVGIDPTHFARFITTYPIAPRLMELSFDKYGNWIPIQYTGTHIERADLARRYHAAMNGGGV